MVREPSPSWSFFSMLSLENKPSYKIFYPIFFISGVCSLAYELIWIKMFIPIFGIGLYSVSAVVSSFMAGLALGSYICGKAIDYKKNLLKYYAFFEFFIGTYSLILPLLININRATMPFFYNNISSNFYIFSIFRFIFAFVLLIIPCSLMGATLPLMSRFLIISSKGNIEKDFGLLYALNTFGAVCGCLIATFFMLEHFGITISSYVFAVINMLIGIFVYLYGLNHKFDYLSLPKEFFNTCRNEMLSKIPSRTRNILFVAFLCGFCALSFEILLVRALVILLPNDVYLFPVILITILIAISFGSFLNSAWISKFKNYSFALGTSMVMSGFVLAVTLHYLPFQLRSSAIWIVYLIMVFPASFFMGIIFPNLVALYSSGIKSVGHDVGSVYSMNTFGSMLGSFLTGFIFIPFFGLRNSFFLCLAVYILVGEFVFFAIFRKVKGMPVLMLGIILSTILLLNQLIPVNLFKDIFVENAHSKGKLVFYKEGIVCSTGIFKQKDYFSLRYSDGTGIGAEISQTGAWKSNHRLKAHIPMILHNDPRTVINIGFGTGITAY
jgi:spermidine synthase